MTDIIAMQLAALPAVQFPPSSRYAGIDTMRMTLPDGRVVVYLRRRFVPQPERFALLQEHRVHDGERLDHIAAHYLGDPLLFWRICDANRATNPPELTSETGRVLRITFPEGVTGTLHA